MRIRFNAIAYIEQQAAHHRQYTFQEGFIALLDWYEIECDERYTSS